MDVLLLQLTLWEYQTQFDHPVIQILRTSLGSFVGEDIELFNRLLAQHSRHDSRRGEAVELDAAYRTLGLMVHNGQNFNSELLDCKKFLKGNRRYVISDDSKAVDKTRNFLKHLFMEFETGTFKHYCMKRDGRTNKLADTDSDFKKNKEDNKPMIFRSEKTSTSKEEIPNRELVSVQYLASQNWEKILSEKFDGLVTRAWRFQELLKPATLARFKKDFPHYVGADDPERRKERKQELPCKKRKRSDKDSD